MLPNIRSGDIVTIAPFLNRSPRTGDVVAFSKPGTQNIIVHRIVKKIGPCYLIKGDYLFKSDGTIKKKDVFGYVHTIQRGNKKVSMGFKKISTLLSTLRIFCLCKPYFYLKYG